MSNGNQTEPKGYQNEEGTSKNNLCGTGVLCFWKRDAKRIPMYAKRVTQLSQKRCPKSLKFHDKLGNEETYENHTKC